MYDYKNFLNSNKSIYNINSSEKNDISNALVALSLKNISTTYNSHISNDFHPSRNNELGKNMELNYITNQKYDEIAFKTNYNYHRKKDYSKFLNVPQSNNSTFCDSKYKFYSNNNINKEQNLNSNLKKNKLYNQLKINDLINIIKKREKILEEKKIKDKLKQIKLNLEQEKLMKIMMMDDEINNNYNKNKKCEEGVQTSLNFKKDNSENKNKYKFNPEFYNSVKPKDKNTLDNDLVNIGVDTEGNINSNLIFDIEENEENNTIKEESNKENIDSSENKEKESDSNLSSMNENNISNVEEYDITKEYLKNETKSNIQEYINEYDKNKNEQNEKIKIKMNRCKSVSSMILNRYEYIDNKISDDFNSIYHAKYSKDDKIKSEDNQKNNNKNIEKNIYDIKEDIKLFKKINENKSSKLCKKIKHLNKTQIISSKKNNDLNEYNQKKKKRQIDNYSYYYKLKDKTKNNNKK